MAANPTQSRLRRSILTVGLIVLFTLTVVAIRSLTRERVVVRVAQVTFQDMISSVSTTGKAEPVAEYQAHSIAPGVVEKIYVDVGETVRPGQLLVRMSDADAIAHLAATKTLLSAAQAATSDMKNGGSQDERNASAGDLRRAQIESDQAAAALASAEKLHSQGADSLAEVTAARQRVQLAETTLHNLQTHIQSRYSPEDRARVAAQLAEGNSAVMAAQKSVNDADIRSPMAGTVYSIPVAQYDFVPGGEDLLDVADLTHLQVRAYFDEPEIGKLAVGQAVRIVWDAKPNLSWHGHIQRAPSTIITYGTRNVGECIISVDDPKGLAPNGNVTVTVTTSDHRHVLSIPREGLHTDGPVNFVYRIVDGKLVRTPVQVGNINLTRAEITGGLPEGTTVALNATTNRDLTSGLDVTPAE